MAASFKRGEPFLDPWYPIASAIPYGAANQPLPHVVGAAVLLSTVRLIEHLCSKACLLKVAVCGERVRESVPIHDREGETIPQAPVLAGPASIQLHRGGAEAGLKTGPHRFAGRRETRR